MRGEYKASVLNTGNYTEDDFKEATKNGTIKDILSTLQIDQVNSGANTCLHTIPIILLANGSGGTFLSAPVINTNWTNFAHVDLSSLTADMAYNTTYTGAYTSHPNYISGAYKRFIEDSVTAFVLDKDSTGKQEARFSNSWLWYNATFSSSILSGFTVWNNWDPDSFPPNSSDSLLLAYVRFKDSNGTPVTMSKTDKQVFLLEYSIFFTSH